MALKVRWTEIALADLENAFEFVFIENPKAAKAIISKILIAIDQIQLFPLSGRTGQVKGTRELVVTGTPYRIVYRVTKENLDLLAVLHSSRRGLSGSQATDE